MAYQFVLLSGPLQGRRIPLRESLVVGRTTHGLHLPDLMVSRSHARFDLKADNRLTVTDLASKTGTMVNGEFIPPEEPFELHTGDRVRIGESLGVVEDSGTLAFNALLWMMVPAWGLVGLALLLMYWYSGVSPVVLQFSDPVNAPDPTRTLVVPETFARNHGISLDRISLLDVRDDDTDGIDEIWLSKGGMEMVITFERNGTWKSLGLLPPGCTPHVGAEVDCDGTLYQLHDGEYLPVLQKGVVVWMRGRASGVIRSEPKPGADQKPKMFAAAQLLDQTKALVPYRMELRDPGVLAGFLAERGVHGAVQYILCENQGRGLPAQVRTAEGLAVELSGGCGQGLQLIDSAKARAFDGADIVAVAPSATATRLLPMDIARTLTGASDDRLASASMQREMEDWRRSPVPALSIELTSDALPQGFSPAAPESHREGSMVMVAEKPAASAVGGILLNRGVAELKAGACLYRVKTHAFHCALARGCLPGTTFVEVVEMGCGPDQSLLRMGYSEELGRVQSEHSVVQVRVEARSSGLGVKDIVRVEIGIRPL